MKSFIYVMILYSPLGFSQGVVFSESGNGTAIVTANLDRKTIDIDDEAAKMLYKHLSSDKTSQKLAGKNRTGKISEDYFKNRGILCSKLRNLEIYHCQVTIGQGGVLGCSGAPIPESDSVLHN